jgi:hypothetical protein
MYPEHAGGRACGSTEEHLPHIWPVSAKAGERWQCLGHSGMPARVKGKSELGDTSDLLFPETLPVAPRGRR